MKRMAEKSNKIPFYRRERITKKNNMLYVAFLEPVPRLQKVCAASRYARIARAVMAQRTGN